MDYREWRFFGTRGMSHSKKGRVAKHCTVSPIRESTPVVEYLSPRNYLRWIKRTTHTGRISRGLRASNRPRGADLRGAVLKNFVIFCEQADAHLAQQVTSFN